MRNDPSTRTRVLAALGSSAAFSLCLFLIPGCGGIGAATNNPAFQGELTGSIATARTTRESIDTANGSTAQSLPANFDPAVARVRFEDLEGNPLLNASGQPFPPVSVDDAGNFVAGNMPVGLNFVIAVDLDGDAAADISQLVQIPEDETGKRGRIDGVVVDPLTTLIVAELRTLFAENGVDPDSLGVSPTAIVELVINSYTHLFEESGIDQSVTLDDIDNATNVADLFDTFVPDVAQIGLNTAEGTLMLNRASELNEVVRSAAEIFLRARFPIADDPGGIDLSFLGQLDNVTIRSFADLAPPADFVVDVAPPTSASALTQQDIDLLLSSTSLDPLLIDQLITDGTVDRLAADGTLDPFIMNGQLAPGFDPLQLQDVLLSAAPMTDPIGVGPTIYISTLGEPDRNFAMNKEMDPEAQGSYLPIINEHLLEKMAKLHLANRVITIRNLHRLLTDVDVGFGARLTYFPPFFDGRGGRLIFETADGTGVARDVERLIADFFQTGLFGPTTDFNTADTELVRIRAAMRDLLAGTKSPTIQQLFGAILRDRIDTADELFTFIRKARVHIPFNPSGPSSFFVVADGAPFGPNGASVRPVSVDVTFDTFGAPSRVVYNPNHTGAFYLSFTGENDFNVELLVRDTGQFFHGNNGRPAILNMNDLTLFDPINGTPFADFVSESGSFFPGTAVNVPNPDFRLDSVSFEGLNGPTLQLFVLAASSAQDAEPVRVNFDVATGVFTADPNGRFYLVFVPETETSNLFGLYDVDLNFMATKADLTADFFVGSAAVAPDPAVTTTGPIKGRVDSGGAADDSEPQAGQVLPTTTGGASTVPDPTLFEPALVSVNDIANLGIARDFFQSVFGTEVPNRNFNPDANPFFDDVNNNGVQDAGEFTADFRPTLFNPDDWRSTDISRFYRRADGLAVTVDEVDFASNTPRTFDGVALVRRNYLPRLNAFRFGRPNTAINLLTTFLPPRFFDGTNSFRASTRLTIFQAIAMINLVMEQRHNVEALIDVDGPGPLPAKNMLIDAELFVLPLGDPFLLMLDGFETLSEPAAQ